MNVDSSVQKGVVKRDAPKRGRQNAVPFTAPAPGRGACPVPGLSLIHISGLNEACEVYEVDVSDTGPVSEDEDILNYDDVDDPDAYV